VPELLAAKAEDRVELDRDPACLVPPVLEDRFSGIEKLLCEGRVEAVETGVKDDGVAAGAGDGDGVELEVAEAADDPMGGLAGALAAAGTAPRHAGPLGFEQPGPAQREPASGAGADFLDRDRQGPEP